MPGTPKKKKETLEDLDDVQLDNWHDMNLNGGFGMSYLEWVE